jgi:hypothetical protein
VKPDVTDAGHGSAPSRAFSPRPTGRSLQYRL